MAPKSKGFKGAMTGKVAGIPVWAWVAVVAGGLLVGAYLRRRQGAQPQPAFASPGFDTSPVDSGGGGGGIGGAPPDFTNLESALAAQNAEFLTTLGGIFAGQPSGGGGYGQPVTLPGYPDYGYVETPESPVSVEVPASPAPVYDGGKGPRLTQPATSKVLRWGGQTFRTQAEFRRWLNAHGSNLARFQARWSKAAAIYANLAPGQRAPKQPTKAPRRPPKPAPRRRKRKAAR